MRTCLGSKYNMPPGSACIPFSKGRLQKMGWGGDSCKLFGVLVSVFGIYYSCGGILIFYSLSLKTFIIINIHRLSPIVSPKTTQKQIAFGLISGIYKTNNLKVSNKILLSHIHIFLKTYHHNNIYVTTQKSYKRKLWQKFLNISCHPRLHEKWPSNKSLRGKHIQL